MSSPLVTQAELVRRITEMVVRQLEGAAPPQADASPRPIPARPGYSVVERAEHDGQCEIFPIPSTERTLEMGFIPIGISARHCHLTPAQVELLFGPGATLTPMKPLKQPGQYAANEVVSVIGPRGRAIERIRVLGPPRSDTQLEVSLTDCIQLGVMAPVRPSGDHHDTPGIIIVGPKGHLAIERGVIRANRHVHLHTSEATLLGLKDQDRVMVKIDGDKPVIYYGVQVRVSEKFSAEIHLDTDDANAVGLSDSAVAQIIKSADDVVMCGCRK
jgi:putative phosphotransacetylase